MTEQKLDLPKFPACFVTQPGAGATKIVRRNTIQPAFRRPGLDDAQMTFGLKPLPPTRRALLIARKIGPVEILAAVNQ